MNDPLTLAERKVYHLLIDFLADHTYQPSVREIARRCRIRSTRTVVELLASLEDKGFIEREHGRSRGVKLLGFESLAGVQPIPLYARVNPRVPYLTPENRERFVAVDRRFLLSNDSFFLKVAGQELADRGVRDGDWVLVSPPTRAKDGDLVAARIGSDVLVRAATHLGAVLSLGTGVAGDKELFLGPTDDFAVLGAVTAVWRPIAERIEQDEER